jgi:hypothetical protein
MNYETMKTDLAKWIMGTQPIVISWNEGDFTDGIISITVNTTTVTETFGDDRDYLTALADKIKAIPEVMFFEYDVEKRTYTFLCRFVSSLPMVVLTDNTQIIGTLIFTVTPSIPFIWMNPNAPRPLLPYIAGKISPFVPIGEDYVSRSDSNGIITITGNREFTLSLQAYGPGAFELLQNIQKALRRKTSRDPLYSIALVFVDDVGGIIDITQLLESRLENRFAIDLRFRTTDIITDVPEFIEHVEIAGQFMEEEILITLDTITVPIIVVPPVPPDIIAAPVLLSAVPQDAAVLVSWDSVDDADYYTVYFNQGSTVDKLGANWTYVDSPTLVDWLTNGEEYTFAVTATDVLGVESELSNILSATPVEPPPPPLPDAPVLGSITVGDNRVTIAWSPVTGAASYNIYWKQGATVTKLDGTKITSATSPYLKKGLVDGTEYAFGVTSVNIDGESLLSNVLTGTPVDATYLVQGWWKGEDDTVDSVNGNNGVWVSNEAYDVGAVGDCFKFGSATGLLKLPNSVNINFCETDRFTILEKLRFTTGEWGWTSNFQLLQKNSVLNAYPNTGFVIAIYEWYAWVRISLQTNAPGLPGQWWEFTKVVEGEPACVNPFNEDETVYDFTTWQDIKITYDDGRWEIYINNIKQNPNADGYFNCQIVENNSDYFLSTYNVGGAEAIFVDEFKIARGIE